MADGGLLEGMRVLSPEAIRALTVQEVGDQDDLVLGRPMRRALRSLMPALAAASAWDLLLRIFM